MSIESQGISRLAWVCRWTKGLAQARQPGDPHLGWREGVHPADQSHALGSVVGLAAKLGNGVGGGQDRFENDLDGNGRGATEGPGHLLGVRRDLAQRLFAP